MMIEIFFFSDTAYFIYDICSTSNVNIICYCMCHKNKHSLLFQRVTSVFIKFLDCI